MVATEFVYPAARLQWRLRWKRCTYRDGILLREVTEKDAYTSAFFEDMQMLTTDIS